jgi:hypothetical protein
MFVLVNLKEGVTAEAYERWLDERYVSAVLGLPSVDEWRGYRVGGLVQTDGEPSYRYVVAVEVNDLGQLGQDVESEQVRTLLGELDRYAEVTQLMTERFV